MSATDLVARSDMAPAPPVGQSDSVGGTTKRWMIFNAVGLAGLVVQLAFVALLVRVFDFHYLIATAIGVESALLHNFMWHQRWTWRDRPARSRRAVATRLVHFHLLNGVVSLTGNVVITMLLTGLVGIDPVIANLIAIVGCSFINFAASNAMVFRRRARGWVSALAIVCVAAAVAPSAEAGPPAAAAAAWTAYQKQVDAQYEASQSAHDSFFALDRQPHANGWRGDVLHGQPVFFKVETPGVADGKIHHWIGAVFIPGISVPTAVDRIQQGAGHESEHYEDVLASHLIERTGDKLRVFMKLRRTNLITVTYNTEHAVEYKRISATRATARSVATKIAELANAGTPEERERSADDDNGFLWRLNAYWRYEAVPGGMIIECESVSLSRAVPLLVRPVANPIVDRVARESLNRTLTGLRTLLAAKVPG
ncbi:MAG: GtrA family protein [Acidobacteria bacterium]|nr:GtrA family protein [Acidobacteriota bacterium]